MAKSKNHTNHNQNQKAHKNGIKGAKRKRHESTIGVSFYFPLVIFFLICRPLLDGFQIPSQPSILKKE